MLLDVGLYLFLELFRSDRALCEDDRSLDYLSSYRIRCSAYAAFKHIRELHNNAFDLERSDAVAGGLDNVVNTSDIPEVAVLVLPRSIACVVNFIVPYLLGLFLIAVVAEEESAGAALVGADNDLAGLTGLDGLAVGINYVNIVEYAGLAH